MSRSGACNLNSIQIRELLRGFASLRLRLIKCSRIEEKPLPHIYQQCDVFPNRRMAFPTRRDRGAAIGDGFAEKQGILSAAARRLARAACTHGGNSPMTPTRTCGSLRAIFSEAALRFSFRDAAKSARGVLRPRPRLQNPPRQRRGAPLRVTRRLVIGLLRLQRNKQTKEATNRRHGAPGHPSRSARRAPAARSTHPPSAIPWAAVADRQSRNSRNSQACFARRIGVERNKALLSQPRVLLIRWWGIVPVSPTGTTGSFQRKF